MYEYSRESVESVESTTYVLPLPVVGEDLCKNLLMAVVKANLKIIKTVPSLATLQRSTSCTDGCMHASFLKKDRK